MNSVENVEQKQINLVPGLEFRFRVPRLLGKPGMHLLEAPDSMGEAVEYSVFFYNPEGGLGRESLCELDVTGSSLIVLGKFDKRVVCRFMPVMSGDERVPMGHQHHLLLINFHSPFRNFMSAKEIDVPLMKNSALVPAGFTIIVMRYQVLVAGAVVLLVAVSVSLLRQTNSH